MILENFQAWRKAASILIFLRVQFYSAVSNMTSLNITRFRLNKSLRFSTLYASLWTHGAIRSFSVPLCFRWQSMCDPTILISSGRGNLSNRLLDLCLIQFNTSLWNASARYIMLPLPLSHEAVKIIITIQACTTIYHLHLMLSHASHEFWFHFATRSPAGDLAVLIRPQDLINTLSGSFLSIIHHFPHL